MTVIASIHQPSSEVFELFPNLCLLSSGRTVYFGPSHYANEVCSSTLLELLHGRFFTIFLKII